MLTITDFINILHRYYKSAMVSCDWEVVQSAALEFSKSEGLILIIVEEKLKNYFRPFYPTLSPKSPEQHMWYPFLPQR